MTALDWVLDVIVAVALPVVGWTVTRSPGLPRAVVLFLAFGLLSALAWTRLAAVDVALVEASIGTGLLGALLMTALAWVRAAELSAGRLRAWPGTLPDGMWGRVVLIAGVALYLGRVVIDLPRVTEGLAPDVFAHLSEAGVEQPVTAVLLNLRGYDTMLEIVVLLTAAVSITMIRTARPEARRGSDLTIALANALLPVSIVLAGYFLWRGANGPGGAFQGGAVLAGGAIVAMLAGRMRAPSPTAWWMRALAVLGPASFLIVAIPRVLAGASLLEYAPETTGRAIFAIELASLITIALVLASFFPGVGALDAATDAGQQRGQGGS